MPPTACFHPHEAVLSARMMNIKHIVDIVSLGFMCLIIWSPSVISNESKTVWCIVDMPL